ncbi:glutathione S-transferase N-terminal domain-containing protein [Kordiimonas sp.]|uniref:glutathione S-transferase N-terminal domain-containing protein n=1 Tax=Kordiimonas sp. TaxID=1970157 RepID=UPI003B525E69
MRQLFELCGEDRDMRFSPYCWRARLALLHKGLEYEGMPIRFLEKQPIESADAKTVPVLNDGGTWVKDSFGIAVYLEETYPDNPLFGGEIAKAQAEVLNVWLNKSVLLGIFPMIVADIHKKLDAKNAAYFRETREKFLGCTLEEAQAERAVMLPGFRKALSPLRAGLRSTLFLSGEQPAWLDYALMGTFMWANMVSDIELLEADDDLNAWQERMLDLFDGHCRSELEAV